MTDPTPTKSGQRPPAWQRRKAFREEEILNAAVELLVEIGVDDLSMIGIARRAGVSEATVYKYFVNRQDIVARAMWQILTPAIVAVEEGLRFITGAEAKVAFFIARSLQDMAARPNIHRATHGHLRWTGEHRTLLHDVRSRMSLIVRGIFEQGVENGELRPDVNVVLAADMVFGGIESIGWRTLLADREMDVGVEAFAEGFARQLFGGMDASVTPVEQSLCDRLQALVERMENIVE